MGQTVARRSTGRWSHLQDCVPARLVNGCSVINGRRIRPSIDGKDIRAIGGDQSDCGSELNKKCYKYCFSDLTAKLCFTDRREQPVDRLTLPALSNWRGSLRDDVLKH